jgi:hypothetical protein
MGTLTNMNEYTIGSGDDTLIHRDHVGEHGGTIIYQGL